jgi:hypothetical protein
VLGGFVFFRRNEVPQTALARSVQAQVSTVQHVIAF